MPPLEQVLPHVNAGLNSLAALLLVIGASLIKARREAAHRIAMLAAFAVSTLFLVSYLFYHFAVKAEGHTRFEHPVAAVRYTYYAILASHVLLAALVPFLALRTIYLGFQERRASHRWWARITFPIWLYVSVTGVVVYLMLYQWFPAAKG